MPEQAAKILSHFAFFRFTNAYYKLDKKQKETLHEELITRLKQHTSNFDIYQVYPASISADILIWTTEEAEAPEVAHSFFTRYAQITNSF